MILAIIKCKNGKCGDIYDVGLYGDEGFAKCPMCGQMNTLPDQQAHLSGKCACKKAIDDHPLTKDGSIIRCP
ncbi:MAG: hypothetical protein AB7U18_01070 [Dehalococcoidia bacterium]